VLASPVGTYAVRIFEPSTRRATPVEPPPSSGRSSRRRWTDPRSTEFVASGLLELIVEGPGAGYNGDRYRDAKTISVEAKLPRVFRDLEIHRLEAEQREQERQREAADRQRRWEAAMIEARRRYDEQALWDDFQRRSRDWQSITGQRVFLAAAREAAGGYSGPRRDDLMAHLDFAERRLDAGDPTKHLGLLLPEVSDPKPDDLKPFLDGWSPHGSSGY
jgi:hypothetical protein